MTEKSPSLEQLMGEGGEATKPKAASATKNPAAEAPRTSILTDEEIAAAKLEAKRRVDQAAKDAEMARLIREEEERLKRVEGQRTGQPDKDELVSMFIDLAEFCDRITVNGVQYFHGQTYTVPRHVADSLRETMQRTHRHQMEIDGKSLEESYRRTAPVALSPAGQRPFNGEIAA